jgi:fimbrial chaperone protein
MNKVCAMRPRKVRGAFALVFGFFVMLGLCLPVISFAAAFTVVPNSIVLDSQQKRTTITITNGSDGKLTLQLRLMKWSQDEKGQDVYEPSKDLVFFPQILTIEKGKEQVVRLGYEGDAMPAGEKTYRLFLQELPVTQPGQNVLQIALRVAIPVFLSAAGPQKKESLEGIQIEGGQLQVKVRNDGNTHSLVKGVKVTGLDAAGSEVFTKDASGWYVLSGVLKAFPVDVFREDCQAARTLKVSVTTINGTLEGQIDVDGAACAGLAGRDDKKKDSGNTQQPPQQNQQNQPNQ